MHKWRGWTVNVIVAPVFFVGLALTVYAQTLTEKTYQLLDAGATEPMRSLLPTILQTAAATTDPVNRSELYRDAGLLELRLSLYRDARDHFDSAAALVPKSDPIGLAILLNNRAAAKSALGDVSGALADLKDAFGLTDDWNVRFVVLDTKGAILENHGRIDEALAAFEEALREIPPGKSTPREAQSQTHLCEVYEAKTMSAAALAHCRRALDLQAGQLSSGYVSTQISDAEAHLGAGEIRAAETELKAAISNATQLGDSINISRAAVDLATVQDRDGEYSTALHTLDEVLPSAASPDARATILNNKALTLLHIGRLSEAADAARQAFAVLQSFNNPGTVSYLNLASILTLTHNPVEAMKLLQALKPALEKQPNTREWATLNDVLGSTFIEVFDAKAAADAYRAEKAVGKTLGDHKIVAAAEIGLASAALQLSDAATARVGAANALDELKYVQDAFLEIQARLIAGMAGEANTTSRRANLVRLNELAKMRQQDLISSEALLMLAYMSKDLGQEDQALKYCDEAYQSARRIGNEQMQGFVAGVRASIYAQLHQYDRAEPLFDEAIAAAEKLRSTSSLTFRFTLDDFVRIIFDDAIDQAIEAKHFARAFEIAEEGKGKLLVEGIRKATAGQAPDFLADEERLIERLEEFESERRILAQSPGSEPRIATLSAQIAATEKAHQDLLLRASLQAPARAILFDSRRPRVADLQNRIAPDTTVISYVFCSKALAIFAVTHSSFLSVTVPNVSRELIQRQMQDFRTFGDLTNRPDVLSELYAELIEPISQGIRTSRVVIVPDGIVRFVPFAALHSGRDYFGAGRSIGFLGSAKLLTVKAQGPRGRQGDLLFTSFSAPRGLPLLKAADDEVRSIASSFGVKEKTSVTRSALLSLAPAARILHIAAHARSNALDPTLSKLYVRADQSSGDGSLTVADIEHLALQKNELVVLSACETALSATNRLNDAIGLPEAFLQAGSRTVVSSLWNIDDQSTQSLMKWFYAALRSGDSVDNALSKAQAQLRIVKPHPYYWAAFVVMGDVGPVFDSNSSH